MHRIFQLIRNRRLRFGQDRETIAGPSWDQRETIVDFEDQGRDGNRFNPDFIKRL